jgi:acyl carrier protein
VSGAPESAASATIATWLRERLGQELGIDPAQIDLQRSPESYGIDSVVGVQIAAELGDWLLGRELPAETLLAAPSLQAVCDQFGATSLAAAEAEPEAPAALGAAIAHLDAGQPLLLLARVTRVVAAGERFELARLAREPALLSLAYRYVDAHGKPGASRYYGGLHMDRIRPWVQRVAVEEGERFGVFVHNASDRALEITVAALAILEMEARP